MMTNKFSNQKPLIYGLIGFITGVIATSVIVYDGRTESSTPVSLTTGPGDTTAQLISSPEVSPTSVPIVKPGMPGMMAQSEQHFIVMMIPHHEGAVAMAELALSRAKHPEIKKLAQTIKTTQTQEIRQMQAWYKQWYSADVPAWSPGMGMMRSRGIMSASTVPGMMCGGCMGRGWMGTDLTALTNAADFDREFIVQMIPHHQMAIMMSTMVASSATHPEIRNLGQSIIRSQSAEIEQMQQWYQTWYEQ